MYIQIPDSLARQNQKNKRVKNSKKTWSYFNPGVTSTIFQATNNVEQKETKYLQNVETTTCILFFTSR